MLFILLLLRSTFGSRLKKKKKKRFFNRRRLSLFSLYASEVKRRPKHTKSKAERERKKSQNAFFRKKKLQVSDDFHGHSKSKAGVKCLSFETGRSNTHVGRSVIRAISMRQFRHTQKRKLQTEPANYNIS